MPASALNRVLAGAVVADQTQTIAGRQLERDAIQGPTLTRSFAPCMRRPPVEAFSASLRSDEEQTVGTAGESSAAVCEGDSSVQSPKFMGEGG